MLVQRGFPGHVPGFFLVNQVRLVAHTSGSGEASGALLFLCMRFVAIASQNSVFVVLARKGHSSMKFHLPLIIGTLSALGYHH